MMKVSKQQTVFKRVEKKYLITNRQYEQMLNVLDEYAVPDIHRNTTVFSLYFDTPDYLLIRRSIDKPVYKEKLRLRTYGVPSADSQVFVEIKKKYKKTVYKRRVSMTYDDAWDFLMSNRIPEGYHSQKQIITEIAWFLHHYRTLAPSMMISYDRTAFFSKRDPQLRITFDHNILWRDTAFYPTDGAWGNPVLEDGFFIMEIKLPEAIPLWLSKALSKFEIYPTSFSKYGTAYRQKFLKGEIDYA